MTAKKSNRGGFREGAGNFQRWPTIRGIKAFSKMTGNSLDFIKAVRETKLGAESIKGNDVDSLKFWIAANAFLSSANEIPKPFNSWKEWREMWSAKREEIFYKKDAGKVVDIAVKEAQVAQGVGYMFNELDRLAREKSPVLAGRNAVEIFERLTAATKEIKKTLAEKFQEIGK